MYQRDNGRGHHWPYVDAQVISCLMHSSLAPEQVLLPLLAFAFLTPLNHFLKLAGCEPNRHVRRCCLHGYRASFQLENYDSFNVEEQNRLWKLVMQKATVYRTPDGELTIHIYPKLPK